MATRAEVRGIIYSRIRPDAGDQSELQLPEGKKSAEFIASFVRSSLPQLSQKETHHYLYKNLTLVGTTKRNKKKKGKTKCLSAKERRELRLFELNPEQQRYELFLPLHELWKQYIRDLCNGLKPQTSTNVIQTKLMKADFHGAIVTVVKSKCPSYVGITGIILQEMKHIFKIITVENKIKVIPKQNNVFSVEIDGFVSHIYGNMFQLRSSERSVKKFKGKGSIDL
ncbi:ribonuclease P protein subunit p29 isoform X2 [Leucoraja erinacea]|uniref:ribonuclease P protein subunit p29 isoform X2 n=1 Tax=Leucoraja erinaceus TaxID=7782 RepID=UPI0024576849|nr:ribonuclease P protein subunit p29 isoform X2 [Leucoraja erinacea]